MYEIERKYRLKNKSEFVEKIRALKGYAEKPEIRQIDTVFLPKDTPSFAQFRTGDPVLRIRTDETGTKIALKRQISQSNNLELETTADDHSVLASIFSELGFNQVLEIEKQRIEFVGQKITIVVDTVKRLGDFVELEIVTDRDSTTTETELKNLAIKLGLEESMFEDRKYDKLISLL